MAQMPASYLQEKVDDLRANLARIDTANGLITLDTRAVSTLDQMAQDAHAIIDEIAEWTAEVDA